MPAIDWPHLLGFTVSPVELFIRGTLTFMLLFFLFRFVVHRDVGALGVTDLLVLVIIADASQNAMAGDGKKLKRNLRRELIADEELQEMLREHEMLDLAQVRRAYLEPDGQLTVIRNRRGANGSAEDTASEQPRETHMAHANPVQIQKYLKGVDYPTDKQTLIEAARRQGADESVCASLDQLPEEEFQTPADVSAAFKGPSQDHAERGDEERDDSDDGGSRRRDH